MSSYTPLNGWEHDEEGQLRRVPHHVVKLFDVDTEAGKAQVEQAAQAIYRELFRWDPDPDAWEDYGHKEVLRDCARAALDQFRA